MGYKYHHHATTRVKLIMVTCVNIGTGGQKKSVFLIPMQICIGYQTITDFIHVLSHYPFSFIYQGTIDFKTQIDI